MGPRHAVWPVVLELLTDKVLKEDVENDVKETLLVDVELAVEDEVVEVARDDVLEGVCKEEVESKIADDVVGDEVDDVEPDEDELLETIGSNTTFRYISYLAFISLAAMGGPNKSKLLGKGLLKLMPAAPVEKTVICPLPQLRKPARTLQGMGATL